MKYRSDIDGLRALAVLPVVGFHAGVTGLSGGFVGVDVFFVISGFLIGSLILQELEEGRFTLANFYMRRFRRILPALFFMLAGVTIACAFVLYPSRLEEYGHSLVAAVLSVANIYFWATSGYFEAPAATKPLLHTWSLAVEEQFYLVIPPLMIAVAHVAKNHKRALIILLAGLSFAVSVAGVYLWPQSTFYLLHSRAWELLLGVLVGMYAPPASRMVREVLAAGGLLLILASIVVFREAMHFPGLAALAPCLGAAAIIWSGSGGGTLTGRALSLKPAAFIGLISYSTYLWHWPIIVLYKQQFGEGGGAGETTAIIAASLVAGFLSWRFVERPFRSGALSRRWIFTASAAGTVAIIVLACGLIATRGLPNRFAPSVNLVSSYLDYDEAAQFRTGDCFIESGHEFRDFNKKLCLGHDATKKDIVLIGDSHAAHLYYGLTSALPGVTILQATASGCRPTLTHNANDSKRCTDLMDYMFRVYLEANHPDLILFSARWTDSDLDRLAATIDWAKARNIAVGVAGPIVEYDAPLPFLLARSMRDDRATLPAEHRLGDPLARDRKVAAIAARKQVPYASAYRALCDGAACQDRAADGAPLQFDYGHLTMEGSVYVARRFREQGLFTSLGAVADTPEAKP